MFEVKWFLFKSEKEMNADKILPIDLYHAVSIANLTLESALKVIHVEAMFLHAYRDLSVQGEHQGDPDHQGRGKA